MLVQIQSTLVLVLILGALSVKAISEVKRDIVNEDDSTTKLDKQTLFVEKNKTSKQLISSIVNAATQTVGGVLGGVGGLIQGVGSILGGPLLPNVGNSHIVNTLVSRPPVVHVNSGYTSGSGVYTSGGSQTVITSGGTYPASGVFYPSGNNGGYFVGQGSHSSGGHGNIHGLQSQHNSGGFISEVNAVQFNRPHTVSSSVIHNTGGGHASGGYGSSYVNDQNVDNIDFGTGHNSGSHVEENGDLDVNVQVGW